MDKTKVISDNPITKEDRFMKTAKFISDSILIIAFILFITIPPIRMLTTPVEKISFIESRYLSPIPEFSEGKTLRDFREEVENFVNDQLGFREFLIESRSVISYFLLNTSTDDRVVLGKDDWLFYNRSYGKEDYRILDDYYRVTRPALTDEQLDAFLQKVEARRDLFADYGITYYLVIAPDKHSIYPNRLPEAYTPIAEDNWFDQMMAYMDEHYDGAIIDLREPIRSVAMNSSEFLYYPHGTHWTSDGAWIGYQVIMDRIAQDFPDIDTVDRDLFSPPDDRDDRDLALFIGMRNFLDQDMPRYDEPINPCAVSIETEGQGTALGIKETKPSGQDFMYLQCDTAPSPYFIAFARNSFTTALQHFFSETFVTSAYDWETYEWGNGYSDDVARNIAEELQPDIFIDQWVERQIIKAFSDVIVEGQ